MPKSREHNRMRTGSNRSMGGRAMAFLKFYKVTAPGGIAYHDKTTRYVVGERLSIADPDPASLGACGRGLHVLSDLCYAQKYVNDLCTSEFYEVEVNEEDIIAKDDTKTRVRSLL